MQIELLVSRYKRMIGLARYTSSLTKYLSRVGVDFSLVEPSYPLLLNAAHNVLRPFGYDVQEFFNIYPISAKLQKNTIKHFTHQMMGGMLAVQKDLSPVVITVHDIVPYLKQDDPYYSEYHHFYDRWMDHLAMHSLRRSDYLISISEYTKKMLVEHLGCAEEKIRVILYGLDHEIFRPLPADDAFRARYKLDPGHRYLLYVGSENPRKNLPRLVEAFARVRKELPDVQLLKVGTPENIEQFHLLKSQIHALGLYEAIRFINHPPQEDLVRLYSFAHAFVFPSLFEGFGMPPLESMACGAPVVCSNAASLPEVVGEAAITLDPLDIAGWSDAMIQVLEDQDLRQDMRARGLEWASQFTWERNARETLKVYEQAEQLLR